MSNDRLIDVWNATLPKDARMLSWFYETLDDEEKKRADRLTNQSVRHGFVLGRGLLKRILARELNANPSDLRLVQGEFGKPYLPGSNVQFNVSHCRNRLVIALARQRQVGVDIEYVDSDRNYMELANRFFSDRELAHLDSLSPESRATAFYKVWTRKEAFVKAVGRGIAFGLHRFSVSVLPNQMPQIVEVDGSMDAGRLWSLFDLDASPGYVAAVCARGTNLQVRLKVADWTSP